MNLLDFSKLICAIKSKISTGNDNISNFFLRIISDTILPYLAFLIKMSTEQDSFPGYFEMAKFLPIYEWQDKKAVAIIIEFGC